jgi:hypothetical protein
MWRCKGVGDRFEPATRIHAGPVPNSIRNSDQALFIEGQVSSAGNRFGDNRRLVETTLLLALGMKWDGDNSGSAEEWRSGEQLA